MAPKPKAAIKTDIDNKIITNGDIKAIDTNAILKDILDCQELNNPVTTFSFKGKDVKSNPSDFGQLNYSVRGVVGSFANFTFKITVGRGFEFFDFPNDNKELVKILKNIIDPAQSNQLNFLVKAGPPQSDSTSTGNFKVANLNLLVTDDKFSFRIKCLNLGAIGANSALNEGDVIFTSIAIHCPIF